MKKNWSIRFKMIVLFFISLGCISLFFLSRKSNEKYVVVEMIPGGMTGWWQQNRITPSWLVDSLSVGDAQKDISGKKVAELLDMESYEEGSNKVAVLTVKLRVIEDEKTGVKKFGQNKVEVGNNITLSLGKTKIYGDIVEIRSEGETVLWEDKDVLVKYYRAKAWFVDNVMVGDKSLDSSGNVIVEVIKKKVLGHEISVSTGQGKMIKTYDPMYRDMEITLRLKVRNRGGVNYFAFYQPVKAGNKLYIPMADYNLYEVEVMDIGGENN